MGYSRSKEDEVHKISTSVFVTNFPYQFSAKDLWETFDVDHLIDNLCTIWVGSFKIHANIAKFHRSPLKKNNSQFTKQVPEKLNSGEVKKDKGHNGSPYSYANVVQTGSHHQSVKEDKPAIVLDDSCFNQCDFSLALMGRVKEFSPLSNLKLVLADEGFENIQLKYLGGYWVMIEFLSKESKDKFMANVVVSSWFSLIQQASNAFHVDERVTWVDIEGIPLRVWSKNTFVRIVSKWGELLYVDDQKETCFHRKRVCIKTKFEESIFESLKVIIQGKVFWVRAKEVYGWVPDFVDEDEINRETDDEAIDGGKQEKKIEMHNLATMEGESDVEEVPDTNFENVQSLIHQKDDLKYGQILSNGVDKLNGERDKCTKNIQNGKTTSGEKEKHTLSNSKEDMEESVWLGHFKQTEIPRSGGSLLQVIDDLVKVGNTMGYNMEGCMKNIEDIIGSQGVNGVPR
ncbi:nucleotide-binding alpha-beta plait domain-containing protein [Tanacetum coccineum]